MNKALSLLGIALLAAGCSPFGASNSNSVTESPAVAVSPSASPNANLPEVQCKGELPEAVTASIEGYRLAKESDFVPALRQYNESNTDRDFTCSVFTADFDEDRDRDYALLLIEEETSNFQLRFALNSGNGTFRSLVLKEFERVTEPDEGVVYTSINYKPPGEPGLTQREYNPLNETRSNLYVSQPAISAWRAIDTNAEGLPNTVEEISSLAYCSDAYYYVEGNLEAFTVCD
jgi:hypothetical protein